ncbi:hypothetical protein J2T09_004816 [Neorhizobium huautlense]|uniref:Glycosyltransferase family 29 (Sialyltransferase) n=1 Tax=Neorhizobium huautlense TaxID=67774 RepID=A0ABT9Q0Y3_9HYPH|nr:hypothetical protein [Neorhizobium huautlense]MDP9840036.1 hypothetical protein [Neorhizobium huautlense]
MTLKKLRISIWSKILYRLIGNRFYLEPEFFRDKKIIVVGPASTAIDELRGVNLDDYDIVVRMNKAIDVPLEIDGKNIWRCDILFHNFVEDGPRSAGKISQDGLCRSNVKTVVYRATSKRKIFEILSLSRRVPFSNSGVSFKIIPVEFYDRLKVRLNGCSATTGLICLAFLLRCDFSHLKIIGFTFFRTPYVAGYNDEVRSSSDALAWARAAGQHDPEKELQVFEEELAQAARSGRNISLGFRLASIIGAQKTSGG